MNYNKFIPILFAIIIFQTGYIIYKTFLIKENFANPLTVKTDLDEFISEFSKLEKNISDIMSVFNKVDDTFVDIASIIKDGDFFKNLGQKILDEITSQLQNYFDKFLSAMQKGLETIIPLTFKLMWDIIATVYNAIEKQVPEIVYVKWGLILLLLSPIYPFLSFQINLFSLFINPLIVLLVFGFIAGLIYINWQTILLFIIDYIWKIIKNIDWAELGLALVNAFKPLLDELISIFKP